MKLSIKAMKSSVDGLVDKGYNKNAVEAYISTGLDNDTLRGFEKSYRGKWDSDSDFIKTLFEYLPSCVSINWDETIDNVMRGYEECDGYYFKVL